MEIRKEIEEVGRGLYKLKFSMYKHNRANAPMRLIEVAAEKSTSLSYVQKMFIYTFNGIKSATVFSDTTLQVWHEFDRNVDPEMLQKTIDEIVSGYKDFLYNLEEDASFIEDIKNIVSEVHEIT